MRSGPVGWVDRKAGPPSPPPLAWPIFSHSLMEASGLKPARAASSSPTRSASISSSRLNLKVSSCVPMLAATSPSWPRPSSAAPSDRTAPVPWLLAMRARACSRRACAISCPITIAVSSSVSSSWSRMPVKTAILPPGMQKALICLLPIRLTSQRHCRARSFHFAVCAIRRLEIARSRWSCGWLSGARAFWARAFSISWAYSLVATASSSSAGTRLRMRDASPTSTWPNTGVTAAAPAANRKPRRGIHADDLA